MILPLQVKLVELSMQEDDTLTILLTGRAEAGFADLIKRMVKSRSLNFHMVCLKPDVGPGNERFPSTMSFKQALISSLAYTYTSAESVTVYEDRVPQYVARFLDNECAAKPAIALRLSGSISQL